MECRILLCHHHNKTSCNPGYACPTQGKIHLDGTRWNKGHVYVYDENNKLRAKVWFYGDGKITYREWDENGNQLWETGEHLITTILLVSKVGNDDNE